MRGMPMKVGLIRAYPASRYPLSSRFHLGYVTSSPLASSRNLSQHSLLALRISLLSSFLAILTSASPPLPALRLRTARPKILEGEDVSEVVRRLERCLRLVSAGPATMPSASNRQRPRRALFLQAEALAREGERTVRGLDWRPESASPESRHDGWAEC